MRFNEAGARMLRKWVISHEDSGVTAGFNEAEHGCSRLEFSDATLQ